MGYLPTREADLLEWSSNVSNLVNAEPTIYGVTTEQAAEYATLHTAFATAYGIANVPQTRTTSTIQAKNDAKKALIAYAREIVNIIQGYPGTTNQMRRDLAITVWDTEPTPVPAPESPPGITILSVVGRTVNARLQDIENSDSRGKPEGVFGASVFYYVGETAPTDPGDWTFLANTTHTLIDFQFPQSVEAGSKVWITAFWLNTKAQSGPAAAPVSTRFADGMAQAA